MKASLKTLADLGYSGGICKLLNTSKDTGIAGDAGDLRARTNEYGSNHYHDDEQHDHSDHSTIQKFLGVR